MRFLFSLLLLPCIALAESITPVYFDFDQSEIKKQELEKLRMLAKDHDAKYIIVIGQTDSVGDRLYNLRLGEARAQNVKSALEELGINEKEMIYVSYGEEKTVDKNHRANRRVDMIPLYSKPRNHQVIAHLGFGPHGLDKDILGEHVVEVSQEFNPVGGASYLYNYKNWVFSLSGFSNLTFLGGVGRSF